MAGFTVLAQNLHDSGWKRVDPSPVRSRKLTIIAARVYLNVESVTDLKNRVNLGEITAEEADRILRARVSAHRNGGICSHLTQASGLSHSPITQEK